MPSPRPLARSQVGRIRYTGDKEQLTDDVPFQSVDEILARRRDRDLFRYLIDKFAAFSAEADERLTGE